MILVLAKPEFVQSRINFISNDNSKDRALHVYKDNIFLFIYDMKITISGEFPNSGL